MNKNTLRNTLISLFVIVWMFAFHYESLRHFYLEPLVGRDLPKIKFLFPPAGWIMFYKVDDQYGFTEVYGIKDGKPQQIDPHEIFRVRTIAYDNIHRNVLSQVASKKYGQSFCNHLYRRFPYFDEFTVAVVYYPSIINEPYNMIRQIRYQCGESK